MHRRLPLLRWLSIRVVMCITMVLLVHSVVPNICPAAGFTAGGSMNTARCYHSVALLGNGKILIIGGYGSSYLNSTELYDPETNRFSPAAPLSTARHYHTATSLPNGQVLVTGGSIDGTDYFASTELYDPASNTFTAGASMAEARNGQTATLLNNGKVLVAGGYNGMRALSTAEIYDPSTNTFSPTATAMTASRQSHTATLLPDGRVLLVGGFNGTAAVGTAEIYDPATNSFSAASPLLTGRYYHTASLLANGKVLVAGGSSDTAILKSAEIYDPATGIFTAAASLASARYFHSANMLPNGKILLTGGRFGSTIYSSVELYDPVTGTFSTTTNMASARYLHASVLLPNGKVFVTGGSNISGALRTTELYRSSTGSFRTAGNLTTSRAGHAAVALPTGKIMLAGGSGGSGPTSSVEEFDPSLTVFQAVASLSAPRENFSATILSNGKVLIAGGNDGSGSLSTAELYDPAAGTTTPLPTMGSPREKHTATLLKNGNVLISGGISSASTLSSTEYFDPSLNTFVAGPSMTAARRSHSATLLHNGKVLIAGGADSAVISGADLFDPSTGSIQATFSMSTPREGHTATLLPSGKVLIAGGAGGTGFLSSAEIYDSTFGFSLTGGMTSQRHNHRAVLLHSGSVVLIGGRNSTGRLNSTEVFDPAANAFSTSAVMAASRENHSALLLPDGSVLVAGGSDGGPLTSAEILTIVSDNAAARRPVVSNITHPPESQAKAHVSGNSLAGFFESSTGATNNSAVNLPLLQLHGVENDFVRFVLSDPQNNWTDTSFSSASFYGLPPGFYRARIITGSVPSLDKMIKISPVASVTPIAVDFSSVSISKTSPWESVAAINTGSADLSLSGASLVGTDAAMFSLDTGNGCSLNGLLGEGSTCAMQVNFHPSSTGAKEAAIRLMTGDPDRPVVTVPLTGTGIIATYTLTIMSTGTGTGRIDLSTGSSCIGNCSESMTEGTTVVLTAVPDQTAFFAGWSGCDSVTGTQCTVTMEDARTVTASFGTSYPLTVQYPGSGSGTVTFGTGEVCSGSCTKYVPESTTVTLTAATAAPYYFDGWSGCDSASGSTCTVSMTAARDVEAVFRSTYALTVTVTGEGTGSVTMPSGTICTGTCSETLNEGSTLTLTASVASGSFFGSWTGCDTVSGTTCTVTMSSARNVTATINPGIPLTVGVTGNGTVTLDPGGTCSGGCTIKYISGSTVTLTPAANGTDYFIGWTGCDSVSGTICTVVMTTSKTVSAAFTTSYDLNLGVSGAGSGRFDFSTGDSCTGSCSKTFIGGSSISITPQLNAGSVLNGWTGCDQVVGTTCTVTMNGARNVSASLGLAISIGGRLYAGFQDAYNSMSSGEQARVQIYDFVGDLICNRAVAVRVSGGYDKNFSSPTGMSSMQGVLTVASGSVIVENLVIK